MTSVWCINPFFIAVADFFINRTKMKYSQFGGLGLIAAGILLLTISDVLSKQNQQGKHEVQIISKTFFYGDHKFGYVPISIPLLFALCTPFFFSMEGMLGKHITQERVGFNIITAMMNVIMTINSLILLGGVIYWATH